MKIVIIPDVHGRAFWKEAVERFPAERFIFLGDYLDPYYFDVIYHEITPESTIENFQEILSFKKANPDRVTLLLGNHDCEYLYGKDVCDYRCDDGNYALIQGIFRENKDLFQIADEATLRGRHFVFVHAGIHIQWMDRHIKGWNPGNMVSLLNGHNKEALESGSPENTYYARALSEVDRQRGGEFDTGSPIWADALTLNAEYQLSDLTQVVGHSALRYGGPFVTPNIIFADCEKAHYLGPGGGLYTLDGKRHRNEDDAFHPTPSPYEEWHKFDIDRFGRPFCRICGSHNIFIRAGMMASHWYCNESKCNSDQIL